MELCVFLLSILPHRKIVCDSCGSHLLLSNCFSSVFRHGTWQAVVKCHCSSGEDLDKHWTATASYRSEDWRRTADTAPLQCSCEERLHGDEREADRRDEALDLCVLAREAECQEVHFEFQRSGFDLSKTMRYRIMLSQHRPVRPIRTHKIRMVNCKRRVDFWH